MAGSSNPPPHDSAQKQEDLEYLNTRNANVSNFVSVQLSGEGNYHLWEKQMLCLLESYRIFQSIVDDDHPRSKQYDSLVKGWIFGSISEGLLGTVVDLGSAKKVWDELKSFYVPSPTLMSSKQEGYKDSPQIKSEDNGRVPTERKAEDRDVVSAEAETETEDNDVATSKARTKGGDVASIVDKEAVPNVINANDRDRIPTERKTEDRDVVSAEAEAENQTEDKDVVPSEAKTEGRDVTSTEDKEDTEVNAKGKYRIPSERKAEDRDVVSAEAETETEDTSKARTKGRDVASKKDKEAVPTDINAKGKDTFPTEYSIKVSKAIAEGRWGDLESTILRNTDRLKEKIDKNGNTVLHTVVRKGHNLLVEEILWYINGDDLCDMKTPSGSTALHIAAILDNREAANLLTKKNRGLLKIEDNDHKTPLDRAYQYMHLDIIAFLLKAGNDESTKTKKNSNPSAEIGVNVLIQAISAKYYDIATDLLNTFPHFAVENDNVLKTIAITFPSGLDYVETLIYPIMGDIRLILVEKAKEPFSLLVDCYRSMKDSWNTYRTMTEKIVFIVVIILFQIPLMTLLWIFVLISLLIWMVYFPSCIFYCNLWDVAARLGVPPIKHIVEKKWEWEKAKHVLNLVCNEIDKHKRTDYYNEPILEAARQNACEVVDEVLMRFPEAILYKDKSGYDIIQLAVIHRSEKIYNLIYIIGEHKNNYKTFKDSLKNNMLHLAGKLAPSHELKRSKGAAFQLQRELQWFEEVKKIVFPTYITDENIYKETPDMVFTREHENLVKEGEKWMRAVAESCSITASLIITIVFAAAITVPGGSNQETGLPLFTEDIAFTIFAISDAISLFASSTALLMFLSILTGRFAQQDFLVSLPRRMRIGLCTLMISTTAMMVAFGATMFIVFCGRKPWMLAPICVSAFLPIASFATLQVPLIVDLFRSSYVPIFGKKVSNTSYIFNKNRIMMLFGK